MRIKETNETDKIAEYTAMGFLLRDLIKRTNKEKEESKTIKKQKQCSIQPV